MIFKRYVYYYFCKMRIAFIIFYVLIYFSIGVTDYMGSVY